LSSYNGCPASPNPSLIDVDKDWGITWNGVKIIWPGGVGQNDDLRDIFQYYVEQFFARVEKPIDTRYNVAGFWGYEYRANVNNPSSLSCHASGTAIDTNAVRHPNGSRNTFITEQYAQIGAILDELEGVLIAGIPGFRTPAGRVGGWTSSSRPDEMHVEAAGFDRIAWARVANKIRPFLGKGSNIPRVPQPPASQDGSITVPRLAVRTVQTYLNRLGANPKLSVDDVMGPATTQAIRVFQTKHGLRVDGIVGQITWNALVSAWAAKQAAANPTPAPAPFPLKKGQVFGTWNHAGNRSDGTPWRNLTRSGDHRWDGQDIRNLIKTIQAELGIKGDNVDGIFGSDTEGRVKKFQRENGLSDDGLVGPTTWKKLFS
jgi:peptidoglycan hydrolase-like protein with peptidoglycan-binding domain